MSIKRVLVASSNFMMNDAYYKLVCRQLQCIHRNKGCDPYNVSEYFWNDMCDTLFRMIIGHPKIHNELHYTLDECIPHSHNGVLNLSLYSGMLNITPGMLLNALVTPIPTSQSSTRRMRYDTQKLDAYLDSKKSKYISHYKKTPVFQSFGGFYTDNEITLDMKIYDSHHGLNAAMIKVMLLARFAELN